MIQYIHVQSNGGKVHEQREDSEYTTCGKDTLNTYATYELTDVPVDCAVCLKTMNANRFYRQARDVRELARELIFYLQEEGSLSGASVDAMIKLSRYLEDIAAAE